MLKLTGVNESMIASTARLDLLCSGWVVRPRVRSSPLDGQPGQGSAMSRPLSERGSRLATLLRFRLARPTSAYDVLSYRCTGTPCASPGAREAVWARDDYRCHFCGFRSGKYQQTVTLGRDSRDVDDIVTACPFCDQVYRLDLVPSMRSGVLVWLPGVTQEALNQLAPTIFAARLDRRFQQQARALLERVMEARAAARERFDSDDPLALVELLRAGAEARADGLMQQGLRLFPLDRRVVSQQALRFNQFPQMLAYWRSRRGPLGAERIAEALATSESWLMADDGPDVKASSVPPT
ncbi:MAG: hypothetical protein CME82_06120 [Halomonas sp.]|nr:hypothetical protein [Halomonas sp.]|tara:strand:+ start:837 stop:1721 length:885 start_codon:yes stop_codon:yes gene_type:complete